MKVTSFEISKKLKELGVDLKSDFYWSYGNEDLIFLYDHSDIDEDLNEVNLHVADSTISTREVQAYTLEDILSCFQDGRVDMRLRDGCKSFRYNCTEGISVAEDNETLADTAARLLIELMEDGIINVEEVGND